MPLLFLCPTRVVAGLQSSWEFLLSFLEQYFWIWDMGFRGCYIEWWCLWPDDITDMTRWCWLRKAVKKFRQEAGMDKELWRLTSIFLTRRKEKEQSSDFIMSAFFVWGLFPISEIQLDLCFLIHIEPILINLEVTRDSALPHSSPQTEFLCPFDQIPKLKVIQIDVDLPLTFWAARPWYQLVDSCLN